MNLITTTLAQQIDIPGFGSVSGPLPQDTQFTNLGSLISGILDIVFMIAFFLAFFWMVWGAFHYIFAGGDKEQLKKARDRIIWAIVGLIITLLAFTLAQFIEQLLQPTKPSPLSFLAQPVYARDIQSVPIKNIYDFGGLTNLGEGVSSLVMPAFSLASAAVVIYLIIGGFRYLTSQGDKEGIAKAQAMITHAIIGFLLLIFIFLILQFIPQFFGFRFALF